MSIKNLMVTGGSGFIGSNFIHYILDEVKFTGRVINVDKLTYAGNPMSLADIEKKYGERYIFLHADICDKQAIADCMEKYDIDTICHFAAESHVDRSIVAPDDFVQTNIIGTYTLLELARERIKNFNLFHHVSTDEVFGSLEDDGYFTESTAYSPNSPYSASKASSDHLVRAYFQTYGLPVTISNCSNNYGPYQFPEKLVPLMILNATEKKPLPVYGKGTNIRDWLYVKDHCKAIWLIMNKAQKGQTYNVGGRNEMNNIDVVKTICKMIDERAGASDFKREELITFVTDRPGHDLRYAIDCSKIEQELGWRASESFETGMQKTVNWYSENTAWIESVRTGEYQRWITEHYTG